MNITRPVISVSAECDCERRSISSRCMSISDNQWLCSIIVCVIVAETYYQNEILDRKKLLENGR